jgi:hypothetical protein
MLPDSFQEIFISYFDDFFVYADDYEKAILALKIILQASRLANIKFSAEKTTFLTKKFKVLGYHYNTETLHLTMNKSKASAFENMKKTIQLVRITQQTCFVSVPTSIFAIYQTHSVPT